MTDTKSLDQLKKRRGYTSLRAHFETHYGPPTSASFLEAQANFAASLYMPQAATVATPGCNRRCPRLQP